MREALSMIGSKSISKRPSEEVKVHGFMKTIAGQGYAKLAGFRAYVFTPQFQKATPEELQQLKSLLD